MNRVFQHAGDLVNIKVAHNLMRLIAEGFGDDDDTADNQLRAPAVCIPNEFLLARCIYFLLQIINSDHLLYIFLMNIYWPIASVFCYV